MIQFSNNIRDNLAIDTIEAFYMIKLVNRDNHALYHTTSFYADVQLTQIVNGIEVVMPEHLYLSNGTLLSVDPPQASTIVDREQYKFAFADPTFTKKGDIENNLIGCPIECRVGIVDNRSSSTTFGKPLLNINDTVIAYKGRVESVSMTVKTGGLGERIIQITGSSPMRNLDMKKSIYISRDNMRKQDPNDSSCDQIYEGSSNISLKWGKT
jgi:hypothetical protein